MEPFRPLSTSEQLADHLRGQIEKGNLSGTLPGVQQLVRSLGVNSVAVGKAIQQLEREGLVIYQGDRKRRLIAENARSRRGALRVGMLFYDADDAFCYDSLSIKQELVNAGHMVVSPPKSMLELGMDVQRVARQVEALDVDAWIITAGSRHILEWFESRDIPAFALHGRLQDVNIAGISIRKSPVLSVMIEKLVKLGHRRIVMLAREERRKPQPGLLEQIFLNELERHGIQTGPFNIPDWEDSPEGLEKILHSLFKVTPPTAMVIGDSMLVHAVHVHLVGMGLKLPGDVSLFCNDFERSYRWVRPDIAHIQWDHRPILRRISQWAKNISQGNEDRKQSFIKASLHEGETIGPIVK